MRSQFCLLPCPGTASLSCISNFTHLSSSDVMLNQHSYLINRSCHNIITQSTPTTTETGCRFFLAMFCEVLVWFRWKDARYCRGVMQTCLCLQRPWQTPTVRSQTLISQMCLRWTQKLSRRRSSHIDDRLVIRSVFAWKSTVKDSMVFRGVVVEKDRPSLWAFINWEACTMQSTICFVIWLNRVASHAFSSWLLSLLHNDSHLSMHLFKMLSSEDERLLHQEDTQLFFTVYQSYWKRTIFYRITHDLIEKDISFSRTQKKTLNAF